MARRIRVTEDVLFPTSGVRRLRVRALADEGVHPDIVAEMRDHGWDVLAVAESPKLSGRDDRGLYRLAARQNRLLVTTDTDFANDSAFPLQNGPGVLILVGKTPNRQRDALLHAGPLIEFLNIEKGILGWNKFIASDSKLRWRGRVTSGDYYDDVIWEASPRLGRGRAQQKG
jgi:predicted nuclease of predicted toxin-antitoxin system